MRRLVFLALAASTLMASHSVLRRSAPPTRPGRSRRSRRRRSGSRAPQKCGDGSSSGRACCPLPPRTPLNPQVFGRIERSGFTVEKVYFESLPGLLRHWQPVSPGGRRDRRSQVSRDPRSARSCRVRAPGGQRHLQRAGARGEPGPPGLRRLHLRHGGLQRQLPGAARLRVAARRSCGASAFSACSSGTASARSTSSSRCRTSTRAASASPAPPAAERRRSC